MYGHQLVFLLESESLERRSSTSVFSRIKFTNRSIKMKRLKKNNGS